VRWVAIKAGGIVRPYVNYFRVRSIFGSFWTWSILALAVVLTSMTAYRLDQLSFANYAQKIRADTNLRILGLREDIESLVHKQSLVLREISTVIREKPDITQAEFTARIQTIRELDKSLVSIVGAPGLVASLVYPLEGNENVMGLNYRTNAEQFPMIQDMLNRGMESITAPVNLVQGGKGLIFRTPIYLPTIEPSGAVLRV
jgi:two-component system, cell cycle sensor histidine kinase PleC